MKRVLSLVLMACFCVPWMHAKVLRVNNTPGSSAQYSDFQVAIDAASIGDTIYLEGSSKEYGEYSTRYSVNKQISVFGPGYWLQENGITNKGMESTIFGGGAVLELTSKAAGSVIRGLNINEISVSAPNVVVNRCCLKTLNLNEVYNIIVHQNFIKSKLYGGGQSSYNSSITNNIIWASVSSIKSSVFAYNIIKCYLLDVASCTVSENIIAVAVPTWENSSLSATNAFLDYSSDAIDTELVGMGTYNTDKDYQLVENSKLLTKGPDGKQIGPFGGNDPYVISGIPNIPVIRNITAPASANKTDGLKVTVTVTTQK